MRSLKKRFLALPFIVFLSIYLPYLLYHEVRQRTIADFNEQQMIYVRQAARGIEDELSRYAKELSYLVALDEIAALDRRGIEMMRLYQEKNSGEMLAISRMDASGHLLNTAPYNEKVIGADISAQPHVQQLLQSRAPVLSDVFTSVQGPRCIAFHMPVERNHEFLGSVAILISFAKMAGGAMQDLRVQLGSRAILVSEEGAILYGEEEGWSGQHIGDVLSHLSPLFAEMQRKGEGEVALENSLMAAEEGNEGSLHAVFTVARLQNTIWHVAVITPEGEVLATMRGFKDKLLLLLCALFVAATLTFYFIIRSWLAGKAEMERRKAEEALRESERNYRTLVEGANSIVLKWSTDGTITYLNPFGLEFFGFTRKEIIGKSVMGTIVAESDSNGRNLRFMIEDIMTNPLKYRNNINENMTKSGRPVWISWTNEPIFDATGNFIEIQSIGNDLTALKNAESAVRESQEKYKMVAEAISDIIYDYQVAEKRLTYVSPQCLDILGYSAEELMSRPVDEEYIIAPEDVDDVRTKTRESFSGNTEKLSREYRVRCKDGSWKFVADNATLLRDERGRVVRITGSLKDISARKELEEKLRRAEKMEAVGTLAGGVAHDLNNILSGLVSYPDLLLMGLPEDSPIRSTVLTIKKSGEKAAAIVNDLLTLARRGVTVRTVINLNAVVREFMESPEYRAIAGQHPAVRIEAVLADDLLHIAGSPLHLQKSIMNLITNACEAMPEGGQLTIATANSYVDRPLRGYDEVREGEYAVLTVADTGSGISRQDRDRIFEPFYTKKVMGRSGTGLGLAVVWGTMKDHRGYIDVRSEEGKGAAFLLYFPVTRERLQEKIESLFSVDSYRGNMETILVVDDVAEQRELASLMLSGMGYQVESAACGKEALERLLEVPFDLVVLDMIMAPGMDGLDTFREMIVLRPGQKAIIASGYSETARVREAQKLGAGAYLKKPYTMEKLMRTVHDALRK